MSKRHRRLIKKPENSFEVSKKRSKFICLMYLLKQKRGRFTKNPEKSFEVSKKKTWEEVLIGACPFLVGTASGQRDQPTR